MRTINKVLSVIVMVAIAVAFVPMVNGQVFAASKKPAAPKITSAEEVTSEVDEYKEVVVTWKKAKNAKKYQVAIRSAEKTWVKFKTVKKTAKNKKKYTKKNKYKVVAKGKKYIVYKYDYQYTNKEYTKSRSYQFVDGPDGEALQPDTTYTFAVRSVNGKKKSAWKTAAVTTSAPPWEPEIITAPSGTFSGIINGLPFSLTIGSKCTVPIPQPQACAVEVDSFTIVPTKIEHYRDTSIRDIIVENIDITGQTQDGLDAFLRYSIIKGVCERVYYHLEQPSFNSNGKYTIAEMFSNPGCLGKKVTVNDPSVIVLWTLDGTEPKLGQKTKTIMGRDYPFGQIMINGVLYDKVLNVRDTVSYNSGVHFIWGVDFGKNADMFKKSEWIKVYYHGILAEETFYYDDYDYSDD